VRAHGRAHCVRLLVCARFFFGSPTSLSVRFMLKEVKVRWVIAGWLETGTLNQLYRCGCVGSLCVSFMLH